MTRRTKGTQIEELRGQLERARAAFIELRGRLGALASTIDDAHNVTLDRERIERDRDHTRTCTRCQSMVRLNALAEYAANRAAEIEEPAPAAAEGGEGG